MMSPEFAQLARWWAGELALAPSEWRDATDAEVLEHIAEWYPDGVNGFASDFAEELEELRALRLAEEVGL